jgi:glucan 1,3-beta-glucosidase
MYYSQLVGNPNDRPVIKGLASFSGMALIDSDPYNDDGSNWYT